MKTPGKLEIKPIFGIDERIPAPANSTIRLQNWTYDAHTKTIVVQSYAVDSNKHYPQCHQNKSGMGLLDKAY